MASPAVANGVIYIYSNDGIAENIGSDGTSRRLGLRCQRRTGTVLWEKKMTPGAFGGVAVANGLMFFTTLDGTIHALNTDDGGAVEQQDARWRRDEGSWWCDRGWRNGLCRCRLGLDAAAGSPSRWRNRLRSARRGVKSDE